MKSENILAIGAIAFMVLIVSLFSSFLWKSGLGLNSPTSVKNWIELCSRGNEDIYCKAAYKIIRSLDKPIVFIRPNKGDSLITEDILGLTEKNNISVDKILKANIFFGARLSNGSAISLDGESRRIVCASGSDGKSCMIDDVAVNLTENFGGTGSIYNSSLVNKSLKTRRYDFILPRNGS